MLHSVFQAVFSAAHIELAAAVPFDACRVVLPRKLPSAFQAKTAIFFLIPYAVQSSENRNVSLYAVPRDYHLFSEQFFAQTVPSLNEAFAGFHFAGYADNSPLDERHGACIAGLGVLGDSGLLLSKRYGSYQFLAEFLTDLPISTVDSEAIVHEIVGCSHCGACKQNCPMTVDGGGCLSAVTQTKHFADAETESEAVLLMKKYHTVWGCDRCQTVCPYNQTAEDTPIPFFREERIDCLTSDVLSEMDETAFAARAYAWRGRACITRNVEAFEKR